MNIRVDWIPEQILKIRKTKNSKSATIFSRIMPDKLVTGYIKFQSPRPSNEKALLFICSDLYSKMVKD